MLPARQKWGGGGGALSEIMDGGSGGLEALTLI